MQVASFIGNRIQIIHIPLCFPLAFLGDPAKQEAPQEETVRSYVPLFVRHDLSSKAYNLASLRPIDLKF